MNTGRYLTSAQLIDQSAVKLRQAALAIPEDGVEGGLAEYIIPEGCANPGLNCLSTILQIPSF